MTKTMYLLAIRVIPEEIEKVESETNKWLLKMMWEGEK
jgi:hypothetical protein